MVSEVGTAKTQLGNWIREIMDWITFPSPDRRYLDEITTSEIVDLAYGEGSKLAGAYYAHALFPPGVEIAEAQRGRGISSSMSVSFPVRIEDEHWGYEILFRAARPSMLAIGWGRRFPGRKPPMEIPNELLNPQIEGIKYRLRESNEERLSVVAGPVQTINETINGESRQNLNQNMNLPFAEVSQTYGYVGRTGRLYLRGRPNGLQPLARIPRKIRSCYLRSLCYSATVRIQVQWEQREPDQGRLTIILQLEDPEEQIQDKRDILLSALILPHLRITLHGAQAEISVQQYAETKKRLVKLTEEERQDEFSRRLYQVTQSGCIATHDPQNPQCLTMTTFGVFDTPRETPTQGPSVDILTRGPDDLLANLLNCSELTREFIRERWLIIRNILQAASEAFSFQHFYQFQWEAISTHLETEATGRDHVVTIVRAPTGAGKTVVFMINAAISALCGVERSTSALLFPTRLLSEDMFRRLTGFIYQMRRRLPDLNVRGSVFMGQSDPLYKLLLNPQPGETMYHYGNCPVCKDPNSYLRAESYGADGKLVPTCPQCGHVVTYMFNSHDDVVAYLPDILITTPDMLFYTATVKGYELAEYGLLGAPIRRCEKCDRAWPAAGFILEPKKTRCRDFRRQSTCDGTFGTKVETKPIRYMGYDEVHNYTGRMVIYMSVFLAMLERMQQILVNPRALRIRYEMATATIANEQELLTALTRRNAAAGEIITIPRNDQFFDHFEISPDRIRHRVLVTLPTLHTSRAVITRALLSSFQNLRTATGELKQRLDNLTLIPDAWDFLLGYVFKIDDGIDLRRALKDYYYNSGLGNLRVEFLSGQAPKDQISRIINQASKGDLDVLLANLVVSLGVHIETLNHMFLFGVPGSYTEYAQIAGRTGRGEVSGHLNIVLVPNMPRDTHLYRHFHTVLSDVAGYYDSPPVRSTNLYCSEEIFGNVTKGLLAVLCLHDSKWSHQDGVLATIQEYKQTAIRNTITRLLCNDPDLHVATQQIVTTQFRNLYNQIRLNKGFLAPLMADGGWLLDSLRGREDRVVSVTCTDKSLLDLVSQNSRRR